MARKANISREEIHQACWQLLEQNYFPNIPRVAEYFLKLDGRKCSNTTLLQGIEAWQEEYEEQQKLSNSALEQRLAPVIKQLQRDLLNQLQAVVSESIADMEYQQRLKLDATTGQYLSLSHSLAHQEDDLKAAIRSCEQLQYENKRLTMLADQAQQRYQNTLDTLQVIQREHQRLQESLREVRLVADQLEVDIAKRSQQQMLLEQDNQQLRLQLTAQQQECQTLIHQQQNSLDGFADNVCKKLTQLEDLLISAKVHQTKDREL